MLKSYTSRSPPPPVLNAALTISFHSPPPPLLSPLLSSPLSSLLSSPLLPSESFHSHGRDNRSVCVHRSSRWHLGRCPHPHRPTSHRSCLGRSVTIYSVTYTFENLFTIRRVSFLSHSSLTHFSLTCPPPPLSLSLISSLTHFSLICPPPQMALCLCGMLRRVIPCRSTLVTEAR